MSQEVQLESMRVFGSDQNGVRHCVPQGPETVAVEFDRVECTPPRHAPCADKLERGEIQLRANSSYLIDATASLIAPSIATIHVVCRLEHKRESGWTAISGAEVGQRFEALGAGDWMTLPSIHCQAYVGVDEPRPRLRMVLWHNSVHTAGAIQVLKNLTSIRVARLGTFEV